VCKCVLPPGDNTIAVNKYIISFAVLRLRNIEQREWTKDRHMKKREINVENAEERNAATEMSINEPCVVIFFFISLPNRAISAIHDSKAVDLE
jgi:hypothetical protein